MSCSFLEFCRLQDLKAVRDFLFLSQKTEPVEEKNLTGTMDIYICRERDVSL